MLTKLGAGILITVAIFLVGSPASAFAESSKDFKKINKYTKQLKRLPNGGAPAGKVQNLVKKLTKLRPGKVDQYYKIGLRKLYLPGTAGIAFANKLSNLLKKLVKKSDLTQKNIAKMIRRLNKTDRLFQPLPEPTPAPASPSAMLFRASPTTA